MTLQEGQMRPLMSYVVLVLIGALRASAAGKHVDSYVVQMQASPTPTSMIMGANDGWDGRFSPRGLDNNVYALSRVGGYVYVGGGFSAAGSTLAASIARWDGTSWSALGSGLAGTCRALAWDGTNLYVGGSFTTAGGTPANNIAKWDGSSWSSLGSGLGGTVYALAWDGTDLYAGGAFGVPAGNIARWDGTSWSALGAGVTGVVWALVGDGTSLYVGGAFTFAGGTPASRIARWDGASWSPLGGGIGIVSGDGVYALAWDGASLYAGGRFSTAGGTPANNVARWDGTSWNALGSGVDDAVAGLLWDGTSLRAGGQFTIAGGAAANRIALWDGASWSPLGAGLDGLIPNVYALAGDGTTLYVGGGFTIAGSVGAHHIARYDAGGWSALGVGNGMNEEVKAMAWDGTYLYAGGWFTVAGGCPANYIARWDGAAWSPLGSGMGGSLSPYVWALASDGTYLYAGGWFGTAGGIPANYIARWDGNAWSALGSGMGGGSPTSVQALAVGGAGLFAGGDFLSAGGQQVNHVALWDGVVWSPLDTGTNGEAYALTWGGGSLYAGGNFTTAGGVPASRVARWDGAAWTALGSGISGPSPWVYAMAWDGANLYVGGGFTTAGGLSANRIARWDGSTWSPLDNGMNSYVQKLAWDGAGLYAGGNFSSAGGVPARGIARWDGSTWSSPGSGVWGYVDAMAWDGVSLYAGGFYQRAGNKPSMFVGRFDPGAVVCPSMTIDPPVLPDGVIGAAYTVTVTAMGGIPPYSYWRSAGALPAGLSLNSATGVVSGTPTTPGAFNFQVTALDADLCPGTATYNLAICGAIALSPASLSNGIVGTAYAETVTASGGTAPYTFTVTSGALPAGLSLNGTTGALSGTPTAAGTSNFTIIATDVYGCTGSRPYAATVSCPGITLAPATLPGGSVATPYSQTITASGGTAPYTFAVTAGALPVGLSLNGSTGEISGTPTATGTASFTVTATDVYGCTGSRPYSITTSCPTVVVDPPALPNGTVGAAYTQTVTASGGTAPYTFAVTAGALPVGLSLNGSTGAISGTPIATGTANFTVTATDAYGCTGSRPYSITTSCPTVVVDPPTLPNGTVGAAYAQTVRASGGTTPYTFAVTAGALPVGLSLNGSTGVISGTPTATGSAGFTITATDAYGCTGSRAYAVTVSCPSITLSPAALPDGDEGLAYSQTLTATGGTPPYAWGVTAGALPPGLALGASSGVISGTPAQAGSYPFTVTATDALACAASRAYGVDVGAAVDHVVGEGLGPTNGNGVRVYRRDGTAAGTSYNAYGSGQWGTNVSTGDVNGSIYAEILTAPGPGNVYGPHVRAWLRDGTPVAKVSFYAYSTLKHGANVGAGRLDGDGFDEILTGPGPGEVFGPHVRAFNFDNATLAAIAKVNFFAYGTLKYGVNVEEGSVDGDGYAEILAGAGPGPVFAATVKGFNYDEAPLNAIAKINFNAFATSFGVNVAGGDADGDGYAEIAGAQGPAQANANVFAGFDYDAASVAPAPGFTVTPAPGSLYGGRVGTGDVKGDGRAELECGFGRDPAAGSTVNVYSYTGATLVGVPPAFTPFTAAGYAYGVNIASGGLGYY